MYYSEDGFLHGFGDDLKAWQNNTQVIKLCEENKIAACFVNGENKWYLDLGPIDNYYSLINLQFCLIL